MRCSGVRNVDGRGKRPCNREKDKTEADQRLDLQRMNTHLCAQCQTESLQDKLIHPKINWLTSSIRQTFEMSLK